jgi:predicted alpha/beta-fold hydrolase
MFRMFVLFCGLLGTAVCSSLVCAAPEDNTVRPLGIGLEELAYPYPVQFLDLVIEGQALRMAYMDVSSTGRSNGKTVVLLHGKSFSGNYWENAIRGLTDDGYRVVVPDQIGFGKSSKPDLRYSFDLLSANTRKLLDTLGVQRAAIVGHSFGGMLSRRDECSARDRPRPAWDRRRASWHRQPIRLRAGAREWRQMPSPR